MTRTSRRGRRHFNRFWRASRLLAVVVFLAGPLAGFASPATATEILDARFNRSEAGLALSLTLDTLVEYGLFELDNPPRLVIDFRDTRARVALPRTPSQDGPVIGLRSAARGAGDFRIVLDLKRRVEFEDRLQLVDGQARLRVDMRDPSGARHGARPGSSLPESTITETRVPLPVPLPSGWELTTASRAGERVRPATTAAPPPTSTPEPVTNTEIIQSAEFADRERPVAVETETENPSRITQPEPARVDNQLQTRVQTDGGLSVRSASGRYDFNIGGRLFFDHDTFDGTWNAVNVGEVGSETYFRRVRLIVSGLVDRDWSYSLQYDLETDSLVIATLGYPLDDDLEILIGRREEPFGMENLTSSRYLLSVERAMVSTALAPGISDGVQLAGQSGNWGYGLGLFQSDPVNNKDENGREVYALTGRLFWSREFRSFDRVHLGLAASTREFGADPFSIRDGGEVQSARSNIARTGDPFEVERSNLVGLEAAWSMGKLLFQAEWVRQSIEAAVVGNDAEYSGGYFTFAYLLDGGRRRYSTSSGTFRRTDVPAWEAVLRLSHLDLQDNGDGSRVDVLSLGVNRWVNRNLRFMLNLLRAEVDAIPGSDAFQALDDANGALISAGNALAMRAQLDF